MVFNNTGKYVEIPDIVIDDIHFEAVGRFNFLGLLSLDNHVTRVDNLTKMSNQISPAVGILNKLKYFLPKHTKITIYIVYNSLIIPHIHFGI